MKTRIRAALMLMIALGALSGCSDSDEPSPVQTSSTETGAASPSPTANPEVQMAIDAYLSYSVAANRAQENPVGKGEKLPSEANFERWSFDPARSQTLVDVHALDAYNAEFRGSAPESHVSVDLVDLDADPQPLVKLVDCQVPQGDYVPYNRKTDKPLELTGDADLDVPFLTRVEVIKVDGKWGVRSIEVQQEGTCEP